MLAFAYYILKVIICSAILFGYYWLFLRNKVYHVYNRFYLLAVIVLSLTLPVLKFNIRQKADAPKTNAIQLLQFVNSSDDYINDIVIQDHAAPHFTISKEQAALCLFVFTCLVFTVLLIRSLFKIYSLKKNNPSHLYDDISLINTTDKSTPFSFLKNIFWNNAININSTNGGRILKHEIAHVQQHHSQDKLFINIIMIVFWCNPVFWLLRKELNLIHEFLTDKKAVEDGDTAAFAAMILQTTYPAHQFEITNNFFYSPIKRRLAMLTKNNKTKVNYISRLLVLPLAVIVFAAFTLKTKTYQSELPKGKIFTVVIDAGHGGADKGATAIDGTFEKDLNLELIKKIQELNKDEQVKIVLTRETDVYQNPKEKATFAEKLNADLFISIHGNSEPANTIPKGTGMIVYTSKDQYQNSEKSKLLASAIINSFQNNYDLIVPSNPIQREIGIWVLQASTCPAVLIDAGFLSNKKDLSYLKSEEGQTQFAKNVLAAIENFVTWKNETKGVELFEEKPAISISKKDTVPENNTAVTTVMADNVSMDIHSGDFKNIKRLIIINGKEYSEAALKNKRIEGSVGRIYEKNNTEMIKKYGRKAANGVLIFENATIIDAPKDKSPASFQMDSPKLVVENPNDQRTQRDQEGILSNGKHPLYIVDGEIKNDIKDIGPDKIKSVNVSKGDEAQRQYGAKAKDGVVKIVLKKDSELPLPTTAVKPSLTTNNKGGNNITFTEAEHKAEFPGGQAALVKFLSANLDATVPLAENWKQGVYTVNVKFIVDEKGKLSDISTADFPGSKTAQMCINVFKKSPDWIPATQNGQTVRSYRTQPVSFAVEEQK